MLPNERLNIAIAATCLLRHPGSSAAQSVNSHTVGMTTQRSRLYEQSQQIVCLCASLWANVDGDE